MIIRPTKPPTGAINSLANLADALDIPLAELERLAEDFDDRYRIVEKKATSHRRARTVYDPCDDLKFVQRVINTRLFRQINFGSYLFGGIFDLDNPRDYVYCAQEHCPAGILAKLDIKSFFDAVLFDDVEKIFLNFFHYDADVADLLSKLTTINGYNLPQGAPTSVALANLIFHKDEPRLAAALAKNGVRYTRFIDDIVISHPESSANIDKSRIMVETMIERSGHSLNAEKTVKRTRATNVIEVFGIRVNGREPRLAKPKQKNIRAAVHQLEWQSAIPNERKSVQYSKQWHHVSGLLVKLKRTGHPKYATYRRRLRRIIPVIDEKKLNGIKADVRRLIFDSNEPRNPRALKRRHDLLVNIVGIVGRTHKTLAAELRDDLALVRSNLEKAQRANDT